MNDELNRQLARRGLELLAEHPRQRDGDAVGVKGENSVKIFGPDLDELERLAEQVKDALDGVRGVENVGVFRIKGQSNLEFPVDREKCKRWSVSAPTCNNVDPDGRGRQGVHADDRGREASTSRCAGRSGCAAASSRSSTSRWT